MDVGSNGFRVRREGCLVSNADAIRAMSDEELVRLTGPVCPEDHHCGKCVSDCVECWIRWLQSPAGGGEDV